jgi:hypothetical protein
MTHAAGRLSLRHWSGAAAALLIGAGSALAEETCEDITVSGAAQMTIPDAYSPFAPADLTGTTVVTLANTADAPCPLAVAVTAQSGGLLRGRGETLEYALETPEGQPLINPPSLVDPTAGHHVALTLPGGQAASLTIRARIPAGQTAPPGVYTDNAAALRVYHDAPQGFAELLSRTRFPVTGRVAAVCRLAAPQPATLDFSGDIGPDARPHSGWHSVRLPEAACNTGARLKLRGRALARDGEAAAGFDDFIDLEARAQFRSVMATLLTAGADHSEEAASGRSPDDGAMDPVDVMIRLRPGRPLAAGAYQSTLTIALEPAS